MDHVSKCMDMNRTPRRWQNTCYFKRNGNIPSTSLCESSAWVAMQKWINKTSSQCTPRKIKKERKHKYDGIYTVQFNSVFYGFTTFDLSLPILRIHLVYLDPDEIFPFLSIYIIFVYCLNCIS